MVSPTGESDEFSRPFGVDIKKDQLDDDEIQWVWEQLRCILIQKGISLLKQLGHDAQGLNSESTPH